MGGAGSGKEEMLTPQSVLCHAQTQGLQGGIDLQVGPRDWAVCGEKARQTRVVRTNYGAEESQTVPGGWAARQDRNKSLQDPHAGMADVTWAEEGQRCGMHRARPADTGSTRGHTCAMTVVPMDNALCCHLAHAPDPPHSLMACSILGTEAEVKPSPFLTWGRMATGQAGQGRTAATAQHQGAWEGLTPSSYW